VEARGREAHTAERDKAVGDLISLVGAVDGILQAQARADAGYFLASISRVMTAEQASQCARPSSPPTATSTSSRA
jgi:hypothetical protein